MGTDDPRATILRRRARFVAASLAAAGIAVASTSRADEGDASTDAADASDIIDAGDVAEPQACLCACALPRASEASGPAAAATAAAAVLLARRKGRARRQ